MNKQTKLFGLMAFIAICFIGFGVYRAFSANDTLDVKLTTTEGDDSHFSSIAFSGNVYSTNIGYSQESFTYMGDELVYLDDLFWFEQMDQEFNPKVNHLIKNHRSFMRGKSRRSNQYLDSPTHLIYTGMLQDVDWTQYNNNTLNLAVLDKETEEEQNYDVTLDNQTTVASYIEIVSSYLNYPELTLITNEQDAAGDYTSDWFAYTIDLTQPTETIHPDVNLTEELNATGSIIKTAVSATQTGRYVPLGVMDQLDDYYEGDLSTIEYYIYDNQTKEVTAVPSFEENDTLVLSDGETIYVGKDLGETIELNELNMDSEALNLIGSIDMVTPTIGRTQYDTYGHYYQPYLFIADEKLYAYEEDYSQDISLPTFQVSDISTQDTLFSGVLELKDSELAEDYQISLYQYDFITIH